MIKKNKTTPVSTVRTKPELPPLRSTDNQVLVAGQRVYRVPSEGSWHPHPPVSGRVMLVDLTRRSVRVRWATGAEFMLVSKDNFAGGLYVRPTKARAAALVSFRNRAVHLRKEKIRAELAYERMMCQLSRCSRWRPSRSRA